MTCEADQSTKNSVDVRKAIRDLDRFLGIDSYAPRDDQGAALSFDELAERANERARSRVDAREGGKVFARITFLPNEGEVIVERVTDDSEKNKS